MSTCNVSDKWGLSCFTGKEAAWKMSYYRSFILESMNLSKPGGDPFAYQRDNMPSVTDNGSV